MQCLRTHPLFRLSVPAILLLALSLAGCSGLSSEPVVVATVLPATQPPATPTANAAPITPQATQAATLAAAPVIGNVSGQISNATQGGKVPPDLAVELHTFNLQLNETITKATANKEGQFTFKDVPIEVDRSYYVSVDYNKQLFTSEVVEGNPTSPGLNIPVKIYETTNDPAAISITSVITQVNADNEGLFLVQILRMDNRTDKVFTTGQNLGQDKIASVSVTLPQGAKIEGFANGDTRYVVSPDGRTITDTAPVIPGTRHIVHYRYRLPYQASGTAIDLPLDYRLEGTVTLLVYPASLDVTAMAGNQAISAGESQDMGGNLYRTFGDTLVLAAGSALRFELRGNYAPVAVQQPAVPANTFVIGLIGGGLLMILLGIVLLVRDRVITRRQPGAPSATQSKTAHHEKDRLVAELAKLDDLRAHGKLGKVSYYKRRDALKAQLAKLIDA